MKIPPSMKIKLALTVFLSVMVLGCQNRSISTDECAGSFEYHLANKATGTVCFVLNQDGSYTRGSSNDNPLGNRDVPRGKWTLDKDSTGQKLNIGNSRLPLERTHSSIRVTINDDLGQYCDRAITN